MADTAIPVVAPTEEKKQKIDPKEARKAARAAEEAARLKEKAEAAKKFAALFGKSELIQSTTHLSRPYIQVSDLSADLDGKSVVVRARVATTRKKGKLAFVVLRGNAHTVQGIASASDEIPKEMIDFIGSVFVRKHCGCRGHCYQSRTTRDINHKAGH